MGLGMKKPSDVATILRDRAADVGCVLASHSHAWATLVLAWLAVLTAVHSEALGARFYAATDQLTATWGRTLAVRAAAWHDAHGRHVMAARVLAVNALD